MMAKRTTKRQNEALDALIKDTLIISSRETPESPSDDPSSSQESYMPRNLFPGGRETLLDVPDRKPLPEIEARVGRPCILIDLIRHSPDIYAQFIAFIQAGAYFHVAAEAVGISTSTLKNWVARGRNDLHCGLDTWYSRLLGDVRRAVALSRVGREIAIAADSPAKWLSNGPGRIFGEHWVENRTSEQIEEPDSLESTVSPLEIEDKREQKKEDEIEGTIVLNLDAAKELETIEALEEAGLAQYSEEHKEALRRQIKNA